MSSISGGVCPVGHYCAEGTSVPSPCPAGTHQNKTGQKNKDDCKPCPIGKQVVLYELNCAGFHLCLRMPSPFECSCQAGFRSYQARESAFPALLGSTASPWIPVPLALCPAQLATSVPRRVKEVSLSPAPKAPTAPVRVSPPQVKIQ